MKPLLLFLSIFTIFSLTCKSQSEVNLENNLTGIYSQSSSQNLGLNFNGSNGFYHNQWSFDLNTNYLLKFNGKIQENELINRSTIDLDKGNWDAFITHQYNFSMIRDIYSDNQIGFGSGIKKKFDRSKVSLSYAILYQNTHFNSSESQYLFRHSLRIKFKTENKLLGFNTEFYYQPNINDFKDYIILGTTKILFFPERKLNFLIQDVFNIKSSSDIKTIHNLTFGLSLKFNKKIEKGE